VRRDADIVVVGAGITGVATARALAGYPGSVVVLEQFHVGHARGSSHGTSRIFRLNYADERFVRMAMASAVAWRELEAERGERLVERVGCLDLGPVAADTARALAACGASYETLAAEDIAERWPIAVEQGETGVFQPDGGVLYADRAYAALLGEAVERGVEVRAATAVRALASDRGSVVLSHDAGELRARAVVVTAGAWAAGLVEGTGIELAVVPTRETVVYVDLPGAERLPPVIDYGSVPAKGEGGIARVGQAAYSLAAPGQGLKAGLHHSGPATDPDADPDPDGRVAAWAAQWAARRYPDAGRTLASETCLYTNTADERFVLERQGRVVVGSACSGHGFKFAPIVGRTLAALARAAAD
jgi:sarcosine oxidase